MIRPIYNNANLPEKIIVDGQEYVKNIDYNEQGQREKIEYGNGVATEYTYDTNTFRLKTLRTRKGGNAFLQDLEYFYDLVGNITRITDSTHTRLENGHPYIANPREYSYDPLYRLMSATGNERKTINNFLPPDAPFVPTTDINQYQPYEREYEYDEVGNILSEKSVRPNNQWTNIHSHTPGTNRLERTSRGTSNQETYGFDANGNMAGTMTNWRYFWDYADRMNGAENRPQGSSPTMKATYFYDSGGMRVKKVVKNGNVIETTIYIDGVFEEYRKRRGNTVEERKYFKHVMDGTNRIGIIKTIIVSTQPDREPPILYQHGDHLGSSHILTTNDGAFYNQEEFYPYGETSFGSFTQKRYRFSGKERDDESKLYYFGSRYYAPWLTRWISCDPAGLNDGPNPYTYVGDNPLKFIDIQGRFKGEPGSFIRGNQKLSPPSLRAPGGLPSSLSLHDEPPTVVDAYYGGWWLVLAEAVTTIRLHVAVSEKIESEQKELDRRFEIVRAYSKEHSTRLDIAWMNEQISDAQYFLAKSTGAEHSPGIILPKLTDSNPAATPKLDPAKLEFSRFAQNAYASRFSETPAIRTLWETAAQGLPNTGQGFEQARGKFWRMINQSTDPDAQLVRDILEEAGYELQGGCAAPLLREQGGPAGNSGIS